MAGTGVRKTVGTPTRSLCGGPGPPGCASPLTTLQAPLSPKALCSWSALPAPARQTPWSPSEGAFTPGGCTHLEPVGASASYSETFFSALRTLSAVSFPRVAVTDYRLVTLKQQKVILPQSGGQKSEVQVWL